MKDSRLRSLERLRHIEEAITDIEKYTTGETNKSFQHNEMLHDAVMLQFVIIGEAINFVDEEKLAKYNYPWYKIRSFRNIIAHEYFNIKVSAVWEIVKKDLPELKKVIQQMLKNES